MSLSKWLPGGHIGYFGFWTLTLVWLWISNPNFSRTLPVCIGRYIEAQCNPHIAHCYPLLLGSCILVDHWSTISNWTCWNNIIMQLLISYIFWLILRVCFLSCDQAALRMAISVCLSVRPSVTPFWQCSHHRIIMNFQVRGQRSRSQRSTPNLAVSGL